MLRNLLDTLWEHFVQVCETYMETFDRLCPEHGKEI